jgi:hypothetical protein
LPPGAPMTTGGARDVNKAVSRTLRETLNSLQRTAEELNHALNDLVAACGSTRPTNALPPILRAQTAAASLAASLEVLSRFVAISSQSSGVSAIDEEPEAFPAGPADDSSVDQEVSSVEETTDQVFPTAGAVPRIDSRAAQTPGTDPASELAGHQPANPIEELPAAAASFDISTLLPEEQDLHRRANRVAKVSMQDIKMLRPEEVRMGREHKDICVRLRDDIEKAHKEYDRRFQSILDHPVDYFYDWMVEILGEGDPSTLGEYPYPSPAGPR